MEHYGYRRHRLKQLKATSGYAGHVRSRSKIHVCNQGYREAYNKRKIRLPLGDGAKWTSTSPPYHISSNSSEFEMVKYLFMENLSME